MQFFHVYLNVCFCFPMQKQLSPNTQIKNKMDLRNYIKHCNGFVFSKNKVISAILNDSKLAQNMSFDASCSFRSKIVIKMMIESTLLPLHADVQSLPWLLLVRQQSSLSPPESGISTRVTATARLVFWYQAASTVNNNFGFFFILFYFIRIILVITFIIFLTFNQFAFF